MDMLGGLGIIALIIPAIFGLVGLVCFIVWVWLLIDLIKRQQFNKFGENAKVIWIVLFLFTGLIGALLYYFLEKKASV